MSPDDFVSLVERLSKLGAVVVKAGDFHCQLHPQVLAAMVAAPRDPAPVRAIHPKKALSPEEERIRLYREELGE
jgi:hypothetical protein